MTKRALRSGVKRFERLWVEWDASIQAGIPAEDLLKELSDETLLELLAAAEGSRRFERDLLLSATKNRLIRQKRAILRSEAQAASALEQAETLVHRASDATQDAHERLASLGEDDAGREMVEKVDTAVEAVAQAGEVVRAHGDEVKTELLARCREREMVEGEQT
jgi:hypothetical protein